MKLNEDFLNDAKYKAEKVWKWKSPWVAAVLAFIHPIGMLYSSIPAAIVYFIAWLLIVFYWPDRSIGVGLLLAVAFTTYAFLNTRWKNGAIEKWRYNLPGTGMQNPKKAGKQPIHPDK